LRPRCVASRASLAITVALVVGGAIVAPLPAADLSGTGIILPVVDRIGEPETAARVDAAFRGVLAMGIELQETTPLRDALRQRRIRQIHTAAPDELSELGRVLGFDWLVTITLHEAFANPVPQITLSAALYRIGEPVYEWIGVMASTGMDQVGWLAIGQINDLDALAEQAAAELARRARGDSQTLKTKPRLGVANSGFLETSGNTPQPGQRVAIAPLNSVVFLQPMRSAEIGTLALMAALHERGLQIVYPGLVRRIMLERGRLELGEVTSDLRLDLLRQAEADWVLTGTVEDFQAGGGINPNPRVAVGCRLLEVGDGHIVWMDGIDRRGSDSQTVFDRGRIFSAGALTLEIFRSLVAAFLPDKSGGVAG